MHARKDAQSETAAHKNDNNKYNDTLLFIFCAAASDCAYFLLEGNSIYVRLRLCLHLPHFALAAGR